MYQVVIAEDEFFVRLGIKSSVAWEENDMQIVCDVSNGSDAWEFIRQNPPDILITDLMMPEMGGEQLIENICQAGLDIYIIVITCLEEFHMVQKMMSFGVRDYLLKATMTEAEILACVLKAKSKLDQRVSVTPSHPTQKQSLSNQIRSYLSAPEQYPALCQAFEAHRFPNPRHMAVVLGIIDHTELSPQDTVSISGKNIHQNLMELLEHNLSADHCIALPLDSQRFLILLVTRIAEEELCAQLSGIQKEISDYLNIRFSLLADADSSLEKLPESYQQLSALSAKHYLHSSGSLTTLSSGDTVSIASMCEPLNQYRDWFGEVCGPSAAVRFQIGMNMIEERSVKSQEEMLYSFLNMTHLIGSYFDPSLEKDRRQCESSIINMPYFKDAVDSLEHLLSACQQHYQFSQVSSRPEIRAILAFIHDNLADKDLTLNSVARHVGLSETYLSSLFHLEVKQSFRKYLTHVRIETAKHLLEDTDEKISNIALMTGFSDEGYFSRVFKKVTNVTPKDWRSL